MIKKIALWYLQTRYKMVNEKDKQDTKAEAATKSITYLLDGQRFLADLWYELYQWIISIREIVKKIESNEVPYLIFYPLFLFILFCISFITLRVSFL